MAPGRRPTVNRNPPVNRSTNRNNVDINSGIDTQMLNQLIATRVAEALAAAAVTHAASTQEENNLGSNSSQNKTCNYKEFRSVMHENFRGTEGAVGLTRWFEKLESQFGISNVAESDRVKFASSTLLDGALTWWNVYVRSVTLDTAHATPWSDFKAMFIRKYCPRNEIKQMENELWNLKVKGTNLTAYNQRFQELILLCPEMVPNADRLLERYIEGLPLNIKVKLNGTYSRFQLELESSSFTFLSSISTYGEVVDVVLEVHGGNELDVMQGRHRVAKVEDRKLCDIHVVYTKSKEEYESHLKMKFRAAEEREVSCEAQQGDAMEGRSSFWKERHGLYVTIVCYVLLAIVVDRGTRSVPLFVVLERDRLKALVDLSVTVSLLWIVDSERDRLIVVRFVSMFVTIERERLNVD
ncbi:reverse transcriptase domain-containing protein [Tanacetum coccineum]